MPTQDNAKLDDEHSNAPWFVVHPLSKKRTVWMALVFFFLAYEFMTVSVAYVFELEFSFDNVMEVFSALFWTVDILVNFLTGIMLMSRVEMRLRKIARNYLRGWFPVDASLVILQLVTIVLEHKGRGGWFILKWLRYGRFLRLFRMLKIRRAWMSLLQRVNSLYALLIFKTVRITVGMMLWIHVGGCVWFMVGKGASEGWVAQSATARESPEIKYLVSVHWAVAQLSGNMEVYPGNIAGERAFAVVWSFLSIAVVALFTSKVTSVFLELALHRREQALQSNVVSDIMSRHRISDELSVRIRRQIEWKRNASRHLEVSSSSTNQVISSLPSELRVALLYEMRYPQVHNNLFFHALHIVHKPTMQLICSDAMKPREASMGEVVFYHGEKCSTMYKVIGGDVAYFPEGPKLERPGMARQWGSALVDGSVSLISGCASNGTNKWLCEGALWTHWVHLGDLVVDSQAQLMTVDATKFAETVQKHTVSYECAARHAVKFTSALASASGDLDDLFDTREAVCSLGLRSLIREDHSRRRRDTTSLRGDGTSTPSECRSSSASSHPSERPNRHDFRVSYALGRGSTVLSMSQ